MSKKGLAIGGALLPVVGLIALFVWGMVQTGGRPGGVLENTQFGEVSIKPGPARPFTLELLEGGTITQEALQGKVGVVYFWASWCTACKQEAPGLARVYRQYKDRGVEFVGVAIWDTVEAAQNYVTRYGITFPNGLDEKGIIAVDYGVTGVPEKYLVTRDGVVVRKLLGPVGEEKLREVLDSLLEQPAGS